MSEKKGEKKLTGNIMNDFIDGGRRGIQNALFNLTPNFVMAFVLIQILTLTGLMTIITKILGPFMSIFGLPGEAGVCLATGWLSCPGGIASLASVARTGALTGHQVAQIVPMIYLFGGQIQYTGRLLGVMQIKGKYFPVIYIIGFISMIIVGLLMRIVVSWF
jgi:spore maturation protein SpmB